MPHVTIQPAPVAPKDTRYCQSWAMTDAGCASGKGDLRKWKTAASQQLEERSEKCETALQLQSQCRRRAGGTPGAEQQLPAAHERPTEEQAVSCSQQALCGADLHMQTWRRPRDRSQCGLYEGDAAHEVKEVQSLLLTLCDYLSLVIMYSILNWRWIPFLYVATTLVASSLKTKFLSKTSNILQRKFSVKINK